MNSRATNPKMYRPIAGMLVLLACPVASFAVSPFKLSGAVEGTVSDLAGRPQMGATVLLFNRQAKLCERIVTDANGLFAFLSLAPDVYSIRVNLASFLPAVKDNIIVQPGMRSLLDVSLSSLFSSIHLVPPGAGRSQIMNDDWKWVLRTSASTRPVLRILPVGPRIDDPATQRTSTSVFSDTRGLVKLSGGDGGRVSSFGNEADLGTSFALATSLFGSNQLQFSGNLGYAPQSGLPSAGFRTTYSRSLGGITPEVSVTMRQLFVSGRNGPGGGMLGGLPALRTMSVAFGDRTQLTDSLNLDYGFELDSVSFVDRLHYFSPYARLTYALPQGQLEFTYTSGNARPDLGGAANDANAELLRDINSLSLVPRVSLREGRAKVQRGDNYELGYSRAFGSRELRVAAYHERVTNAALAVVAPQGEVFSGDMMPDLFSRSEIFNAGDYHTLGYTASLTQNIGENYKLTVMYGSVGVLVPTANEVGGETPDDLRAMIRASRRDAVTTRAAGTIPVTGTHFMASYQWTDYRSATPGHLYSTQSNRPDPGLNLYVRQPIPQAFGLPWRMEATADLRNLLAQGYLPLSLVDGRRLLLVHTPRSFRGGVSFTF